MNVSFQELQSYFYVFLSAVSIVVFVIAFNNLLVGNKDLINAGLSFAAAGTWIYWIFTVSFIGLVFFLYMYYKAVSNARKFNSIISGSSKQSFIKNIKELEELAYKLGPTRRLLKAIAKTTIDTADRNT